MSTDFIGILIAPTLIFNTKKKNNTGNKTKRKNDLYVFISQQF